MFCLTFEILLFVDFYHRPHNYLQVFQQFNIKSKLWSKIIKPIVKLFQSFFAICSKIKSAHYCVHWAGLKCVVRVVKIKTIIVPN